MSEQERASKADPSFYNPILEILSHHFCFILFKSLGLGHIQGERVMIRHDNKEGGVIGSHIRGYLPQGHCCQC